MHANDDVRRLALLPAPEGVNLQVALQQIQGRQLSAQKLPTWAATDGLLYPPHLSLEQCSSEATASYKRDIVKRLHAQVHFSCFCDLTGGLGVDFSSIAPLVPQAHYIEQNPVLCDLARHNLPLLGCPHAEVHDSTAEESLSTLLPTLPPPVMVMIDPARRQSSGRKVALIEDCSPDVCALQNSLRQCADYTLLKLSPMLDLTAALRTLERVTEVHVVAVSGECKELLLLMQGNASTNATESHPIDAIPIHCVDLQPDGSLRAQFCFTLGEEKEAPTNEWRHAISLDEQTYYLYEPNASILKAGAFKRIGCHFALSKLAPSTHLYISTELIPTFPGRIWRIIDYSSFSKKELRRLLQGVESAELTVRGFPTSVAALRKQLRLRDGGNAHFIATSVSDGSKLLIKVARA